MLIGDGNNEIDLRNASGNNTITAGNGDDTFYSSKGNDTITLGASEYTGNQLVYDISKNTNFGTDTYNFTKGEFLSINVTEAVNGKQLAYSKVGNDIVVTAYGSEGTEKHSVYTKTESVLKNTSTTGYKYVTSFSGANVVSYTKTVVEENYDPVADEGPNNGKYEKVKTTYTYTKNETTGVYGWVADGDPTVAEVNDPVDGSIVYERILNNVPSEYVWNNSNPPTDMGTTYVKTVKRYAWDGSDWSTTPEVVGTPENVTSNTPVDAYYKLETTSTEIDGYKVVADATETEAQKAAEAGTIYQLTSSVYKNTAAAGADPVWQWVETGKSTSATSTTLYQRTDYIDGTAQTPVTLDGEADADIMQANSVDTVDAKVDEDVVLGKIVLKNLASNPALAYVSITDGTGFGLLSNKNIVTVATAATNTFNHNSMGSDVIESKGTNDTIRLTSTPSDYIYNNLNLDSTITKAATNKYVIDINGTGINTITYTNKSGSNYNLNINDNGVNYKVNALTADVTENKNTANTINLFDVAQNVNSKFNDSSARDIVVGANKDADHKNVFSYQKGGMDTYIGGNGIDNYNVQVSAFNNANNRLVINDQGGSKDVLNLEKFSLANLGIMFDVSTNTDGYGADGIFNLAGWGADNTLVIYDKSQVKSVSDYHVAIANYNGNGKIETINAGNTKIDMAATIAKAQTAVVGWLDSHGFASTMEVEQYGNQYDKASLLAYYNNVTAVEDAGV